MSTTITPTRSFLCYENMFSNAVRAHIFGELADLAAPTVKFYRSDLYHDAGWLNNHVNGPTTFFYGVRETGTHIGHDGELIAAHSTHVWQVDITVTDRGKWELHLKLIK